MPRVDQAEGEGQKLYYFHTDQIGTPLELTDSDGKIYPWGNLIEKCSEYGNRLQRFGYDGENRLVRAETWVNGKLESTGHYRYDSLGRRIAKQAEINGKVEQKRFLWQGLASNRCSEKYCFYSVARISRA